MGTHTHAYTYIGHTVPAVHLSRIGGAMLEQENGMRGPRSAEGSSKTGPPNYFLPKPFPHPEGLDWVPALPPVDGSRLPISMPELSQ